ncbi:MAG: hypothetical protein AAGA21_06245 [Pseudomonadota bacterium]
MTHSPFFTSSPAIAAAILLTLTACSASPTPYQVADGEGGYTNRKLESGGYQVTFTGNGATPRQSIQEAVLFRAAQVTLQADSDYFEVVSNKVEPVSEPVEDGGFGLSSFFGGGADGGLVSTVDFVLLDDAPAGNNPNIYNASDLIDELRDSVLSSNSAATSVRNGAIVNDLRAPRTRDY